jgi:hypothetical protein
MASVFVGDYKICADGFIALNNKLAEVILYLNY